MLSVNSYRKIASYVREIRDYTECLTNNVECLATADNENWQNLCEKDVKDAGDHITATIAKIVNLCANEFGDSVTASK